MLFTLWEFIDMAIMTLAVGFIFKDIFRQHVNNAFLFSCLVTAPALILHELGHKFVALAHGISATFHASYGGLLFGMALKMLTGFTFFIPAYVSIEGSATPLAQALIAGAGPFVNLALFCTAWLLLKQKKLKATTYLFLQVTKQVNLFLFIFNMLPIPGFDGFTFYQGLFHVFF